MQASGKDAVLKLICSCSFHPKHPKELLANIKPFKCHYIKANGQALRFIQPEYVMPSDMLRAVRPHKGLKDEYTLTYKHAMCSHQKMIVWNVL